ncbi:MAG: hypothetical protein RSE41_00440 [Clostridia bacterium]
MKTTTVAAISIGVINIPTGATRYNWSIYEDPEAYVYLTQNNSLFYAAPDTFNIGEEITLRSNDTNRKLLTDTIVDCCPCIKETVIDMLYKNGYDYKPKRAFKKAAFSRKLKTSYSIK